MWWPWAVSVLLLVQSANPGAEGLKALNDHNYALAAQAFEQAIQTDPDDYSAHFNLGFAYTMLKRTPEAVTEYRKVLELKPGLYEAELNLSVLLFEQRDFSAALTHLRVAVEKKPEEFRPNYYLGQAYYGIGDDASAERCFRKAAQLNPQSANAQVELGRSIANQRRLEEAEIHYRRAAQIDPEFKQYLIELGSRFEEKGKNAAAIRLYREFPGNPLVGERLGNLLLQAHKPKEALPYLQLVVNRSPTPANRFALATAYVETKQPVKAIPLLKLALEGEPGNFDLRMMYGRLLRDQRKFALAAQEFLRAVRIKPDSSDAWKELAGALNLMKDYPQALVALDRVEALGKAPPAIYFFRAIILDKMKQYKPALASYEKFVQLSHDVFPDQEFISRQRIKIIKRELRGR